ncbi:MAG: hypothetical protein K2Q15_08355, partial [Burkholderiales bacterium]|nr:hypothetical protein [Burkholderiales bacterium]
MDSISIDQKSITSAFSGQLDLDVLINDLRLPDSTRQSKCIQIGDDGYIISREFQPNDALLTISLRQDGPLAGLEAESRQEAFGRMLKCLTMLSTNKKRSWPAPWKVFQSDNFFSFHADRRLRQKTGEKGEVGRVLIQINQVAGLRLFAFYLDKTESKNLYSFSPDEELLNRVNNGLAKAIKSTDENKSLGSISPEVSLEDVKYYSNENYSLDEWYTKRLKIDQIRFVDHPLTSSIRLVGPAGSGKTKSLIVKCLIELRKAKIDSEKIRILFLTHAASTSTKIENDMFEIAPELTLDFISGDQPALTVTTLYALSNAKMRYDLDDLTPVSLDGYEGRELQAEILNSIIENYKSGDWIAYKLECLQPFRKYMESEKNSTERKYFIWELLNEFACVLDANGVRSGPAQREKYLSEKRKAWMMELSTKAERQVILGLYDNFRAWLKEIRAIGGDQMISDFLNYLDSFRWEATRGQDGFDAIFVDELHLFNRQERAVFRNLLSSSEVVPIVLMACDAKQSPRDTFLGIPNGEADKYNFWKDAKLGNVEKMELV